MVSAAQGCVEVMAGMAAVVTAAREDAAPAGAVGLRTRGAHGAVATDFAAIGRA
ncbi:MAG: hypothetical protein HOW59_10790, partial [Nonomuraea sp.]|nr:hypothetical protein [Nonomuraea sp.]